MEEEQHRHELKREEAFCILWERKREEAARILWKQKRAFTVWQQRRAYTVWKQRKAYRVWKKRRAYIVWKQRRAYTDWKRKRAADAMAVAIYVHCLRSQILFLSLLGDVVLSFLRTHLTLAYALTSFFQFADANGVDEYAFWENEVSNEPDEVVEPEELVHPAMFMEFEPFFSPEEAAEIGEGFLLEDPAVEGQALEDENLGIEEEENLGPLPNVADGVVLVPPDQPLPNPPVHEMVIPDEEFLLTPALSAVPSPTFSAASTPDTLAPLTPLALFSPGFSVVSPTESIPHLDLNEGDESDDGQ